MWMKSSDCNIRRLLPVILPLLLILSAVSGCHALPERSYSYTEPVSESKIGDRGDVTGVGDYDALRRELLSMVARHEESGELRFLAYEGDVNVDISRAFIYIKTETALGAYAVDVMSYSPRRIVSYHEADIYISYKRSREQTESIISYRSVEALAERIRETFANGGAYAVFRGRGAVALDVPAALRIAWACYYADPQLCAVRPEIRVSQYPETSREPIVEIQLDYGVSPAELQNMRRELAAAVTSVSADIDGAEDVFSQLQELYAKLNEICEYTPDSAEFTAYDALVSGSANSEGIAMAYLALCRESGLDAVITRGRLRSEEHCWNTISVDGQTYHIDVSESVFLSSDAEMTEASYTFS